MSALSVCFCPSCSCCWWLCGQCSLFSIKGDARWLLLGKFCILSHWYLSPYLTSIDVDVLCDPTTLVPSPSLIPWWCLPVSSFSFYYMLAQCTCKLSFYQSSKWKGNFESPPPHLCFWHDLKLSGVFLLQTLSRVWLWEVWGPNWFLSITSLSLLSQLLFPVAKGLSTFPL